MTEKQTADGRTGQRRAGVHLGLSPERVAAALRRAHGSQREAARALGCGETTVGYYRKRYPTVAAAFRSKSARPPGRFTAAQVADALRRASGVKSRAAALLGCCERLIGKYIRWYPSVRRAYGQAWRGRGHSGRLGRGGRYLRFTAEEVAAALLQAKGNREEAARKLDCRLETVNLYLQRYRVVRAALQEAREVRLDHVESKLADAVDAGEWRAVSFVLVHLGKERGYDRKRPLQPRVRPSSMPRDFPKRVRETYARLAAKEAKEQQGKPRGLP